MPPTITYNQNGTPTPGTVTSVLTQASQSTGVPLPILTAIAQNESSGGQNAKFLTTTNAGGFMQMTPIALQQVNDSFGTNYSMADMADPSLAAMAGAQYVSYLTTTFDGNTDAAIAAYNGGQGNVSNILSQYGEVTPATIAAYYDANGTSALQGTSAYLQKAQSSIGSPGNLAPGQTTTQSNAAAINNNPPAGDALPDPIAVSPLPTPSVSQEQLAALNPPLVNPVGLDAQPWYQDTNILTGNPRLHKLGFPQGFPLIFEVYMDQSTANSLLTTTGTVSGAPIIIPLNCSVEKFHISSKHVVVKTPTRTGFHLTMWGMAADTIEGSGSTGVFLNQFGLTDFLSLSGTSTDAVNAVLGAYGRSPSGVNVTEVWAASGNPIPPATPLTAATANLNAQQLTSLETSGNFEPFRIAAEDAFIEFLSLFQMNGTTWLHPSGYSFDPNNQTTGVQNNANQTQALAAYSTGAGATDVEIKARNNDVYKRGYVVMKFRNSQYLGFFKSLNWVMDADHPYAWKFNFVFQVERTLSLVYYPTPTAAITDSNSGLASSGVQVA